MTTTTLKTIPLTSIEPGSRYRKDYGDLDEMCHSIKKHGQITPITVGLNPDSNSPQTYILAAGGRRLAAFKKMAAVDETYNEIDAKIYQKVLTDLEYRSIELVENIHRKDFDYAERLKIMAEVNRLQQQIHGKKVSRDPSDTGWSQSDTAKLLGKSPATVTQDLKLAAAIEQIPELANCKNKSDAMKKLRRIETTIVNKQLSTNYQKTIKNESGIRHKLSNAYITKDFFKGIKSVPDNTVDFCEIDPPYAIDLTKIKRNYDSYEQKTYNEIDLKDYNQFMYNTFRECFRVMNDNSWLICWFGPEPWFQTIYDLLDATGFRVHRLVGIWYKGTGQTNSPGTRMANSYEMFYYARKGNAQLQTKGRPNVFEFAPVPHSQKYHPTQRPNNLIKELLKVFCKPNSTILVPFLGSGQTIISAHELNMNAYGFDLSEDYKDEYIIRLKDEIK